MDRLNGASHNTEQNADGPHPCSGHQDQDADCHSTALGRQAFNGSIAFQVENVDSEAKPLIGEVGEQCLGFIKRAGSCNQSCSGGRSSAGSTASNGRTMASVDGNATTIPADGSTDQRKRSDQFKRPVGSRADTEP